MKSWKTTVLGIIAGISILLVQATAILDNDPETVFSLSATLTGVGMLGLGWFARDKNVSSEEEGLK